MLVEVTEEEFELIKKILDEAEEPGYMNGEFSYWDRRRMAQGKPPVWAKSMKDVPARKKELRQSSAPSEIAMRSVTSEDGKAKKPYSESDWRADKEARKASNEKLMKALETLLPIDSVDYSFDENEVSAIIGDYVFRVSPRGPRYYVLRFNSNSVLDRKNQMCKSLDEVVKFIKANCD